MPNEQNKEDSPEDSVKLIAETPMILDKVDYVYASYAQVSTNNLDFRLAFGDRLPPDGHVKPVIGIIMSHVHAKALLEVLSVNVPKIDALMDRLAKQENEAKDHAPQP
jgi:hypothetical protein